MLRCVRFRFQFLGFMKRMRPAGIEEDSGTTIEMDKGRLFFSSSRVSLDDPQVIKTLKAIIRAAETKCRRCAGASTMTFLFKEPEPHVAIVGISANELFRNIWNDAVSGPASQQEASPAVTPDGEVLQLSALRLPDGAIERYAEQDAGPTSPLAKATEYVVDSFRSLF